VYLYVLQLTIEEAKSYEAAIEAEYAILTGKNDESADYFQQVLIAVQFCKKKLL